ncbi:MAG: hypothetical protein F6K55_43615 [Moorea sp. SIO4A3]|nr:hypothetical protein [Moorena sp. SIO4A3]
MANLITGQTHHYGLGEPVRSWGEPPLALCMADRCGSSMSQASQLSCA